MHTDIGKTAMYRPTEAENDHLERHGCKRSNELPAVVVSVNGDKLNLKVFPEGPEDTLWKEDVTEGDQPGQYFWPAVEAK